MENSNSDIVMALTIYNYIPSKFIEYGLDDYDLAMEPWPLNEADDGNILSISSAPLSSKIGFRKNWLV